MIKRHRHKAALHKKWRTYLVSYMYVSTQREIGYGSTTASVKGRFNIKNNKDLERLKEHIKNNDSNIKNVVILGIYKTKL